MDSEKFSRQTGDFYRSIGHFVVEFSLLVHTLETYASRILGEPVQQGRRGKDKSAAAQRALSRYFEAMRKAGGALANAEDRTVMKQLRSELSQLVKERDRVAHDAWFIGWGSSETTDWSSGERWRYRSGAEWTPVDVRTLTAESIERLADDADRLRRLVGNVAGAVLTLPYHPGEGPAHVLKIVDGRLAMNR